MVDTPNKRRQAAAVARLRARAKPLKTPVHTLRLPPIKPGRSSRLLIAAFTSHAMQRAMERRIVWSQVAGCLWLGTVKHASPGADGCYLFRDIVTSSSMTYDPREALHWAEGVHPGRLGYSNEDCRRMTSLLKQSLQERGTVAFHRIITVMRKVEWQTPMPITTYHSDRRH